MALNFLAAAPTKRAPEAEVGVRRLGFAPQSAYDNGALMCTSACTCMCIMLLSGGVDAGGRASRPSEHARVLESVEAVMAMASRVHGIVESGLERARGGGSAGPAKRVRFSEPRLEGPAGPAHSMAGVWEVFRCLCMTPAKLGIETQELIVVGASRCGGRTVLRPAAPVAGAGAARPKFLYEPSRCFVTIGMVPDCLRTSDSTPCGCVLTCGGHSICAMHDGAGGFALFDPLPGTLAVGLTGRQLADEIAGSPCMRSVSGEGRHDGQCDATLFYRAS